MNSEVKVTLVQLGMTADKEENVKRGAEAFRRAAALGAKLVVFPELSFSPFIPQYPAADDPRKLAEPVPGPTTDLFCSLASKWQAVAVVNLYEREGDWAYDTSVVIDSSGAIAGRCRMVHIIEAPAFHEKGYYAPGENGSLVFPTSVGRIGIATCYDRHFPEYMRRLALEGAEIVVTPQAGAVGEWPDGLLEAEMRVASFQNGYFCLLCNRVGKEDFLTFEGKSFVTAPDGRLVAQAPALQEHALEVAIDKSDLDRCHARRHFIPDRRPDVYAGWLTQK